jgi:hypothetical protein
MALPLARRRFQQQPTGLLGAERQNDISFAGVFLFVNNKS